ncbi:MAG TPA: argininosuccinate lyase [Spirochaetia bacterium]|nr:argininosuccinate lyase [Spirochaetia bacterium]
MSKLWRKDYDLDVLIEEFTVSNDYLLDARLVPADCLASLAHATMLESIGILSSAELAALKGALIEIIQEHREGRFTISRTDEDCHTAIENALTERVGEAGKKIHTGRSRNDQVLAALRLYARSALLEIARETTELSRRLADFAERTSMVPMPGRTHMQLAMPSSVGLWAGSFGEELLDDLSLLWASYVLNDQSPLGSAASYGVPLPLDRELTARLLGFSRLQNNVLYANNSRGKFEAAILDALDQIGLSLSKLAEDLILFSMPEFGYFSLPAELCSGSSIMPQKRNPDALELMRARSASVSACSAQVKGIIRSLPSGYNRDFQETKEPFFKGLDIALSCLRIMKLTVEKLEVHEERLRAALTPELFATDAAIELVRKGTSFRDAYREVGLHLDRLAKRDATASIALRTSSGTSGNLGIERLEANAREWSERAEAERARVDRALAGLAGLPVAVA